MGIVTCGHVDMQGFDVVLECIRPKHDDDLHISNIGQRWHCSVPDEEHEDVA